MSDAEMTMTHAEAQAAAVEAMQNTLIADGLKRLGRPTLEFLMNCRAFLDVWSPCHTIRPGRLTPLRFHYVGVAGHWAMSWCDDAGNTVAMDRETPIYITVRYAGADDYPFATQVGQAAELMLANKGYNLIDYRQHDALQRLVADGVLVQPRKDRK